jgi:hypothetical protein
MKKKSRRNQKTQETNTPRNIYAVIASMKPLQIFHHRGEQRGGDVNDSRQLIEEYEEEDKTIILYRPVGPGEMELIERDKFLKFPPRLRGQPFFYPVCNKKYAKEINRWNVEQFGIGYITKFRVLISFLAGYQKQIVGNKSHEEYWIYADDMGDFNASIVGEIEVVGKEISKRIREELKNE